jgi:hypothetical protein
VVLIVLAAVAVGAVIGALVSGGDDTAAPPSTTTTTAPIDPDGRRLVGLLDRAAGKPLHLQYSPPGDPTSANGAVSVEIWRDGDKIRQDVLFRQDDLENRIASFVLPSGAAVCQKTGTEPWQCAPMGSTSGAAASSGLVDAALGDLAGREVAVKTEKVGAFDARCFTISAEDASDSELCVTDDGVPVRIAFAGGNLDASVVDHAVDPAAFETPAKVTQPTAPPPTTSIG